MTNTTTITRRIAVVVAGPLLASGVITGALIAGGTGIASAQPSGATPCSNMAMPSTIAAPAPNRMTRAGQISAIRSSAAAESMPAQCTAPAR